MAINLTRTQELSGNAASVFVTRSGNYMAFSDQFSTGAGLAGQVNIYQLVGAVWTFLQSLQRPGGGITGDQFGSQIQFSSDGATLFIADAGASGARGSVFVYTLSGGLWTNTQMIQGTDGAVTDDFGITLAFAPGAGLLVGASQSPSGLVTAAGNVYYYTLVAGSWTLQQKFHAADTTTKFSFAGLSAGAGWLIVSGNTAGGLRGYFFQLVAGVWTQQQELTPAAGFTYATYTVWMSASGLTAVIGGISTGAPFNEFAEVWVNVAGVWSLQQRILHALNAGGSAEGFAQSRGSISGDDASLVIGADSAIFSGGVAGPGQAYLYTVASGVWSLALTLLPDPAQLAAPGSGLFGVSVFGSLAQGFIFIDQQQAGKVAILAGLVYVFQATGATLTLTFKGMKVYGGL